MVEKILSSFRFSIFGIKATGSKQNQRTILVQDAIHYASTRLILVAGRKKL
jgi:hypothetical protein